MFVPHASTPEGGVGLSYAYLHGVGNEAFLQLQMKILDGLSAVTTIGIVDAASPLVDAQKVAINRKKDADGVYEPNNITVTGTGFDPYFATHNTVYIYQCVQVPAWRSSLRS